MPSIVGSEFIAIEGRVENTILTKWNSLPNLFKTLKRFICIGIVIDIRLVFF